jgi:beta-lactamase class A
VSGRKGEVAERFGDARVLAAIDGATADFSGTLACYARNLETGEELGIDADAVVPTASVIKVAIMAELYR